MMISCLIFVCIAGARLPAACCLPACLPARLVVFFCKPTRPREEKASSLICLLRLSDMKDTTTFMGILILITQPLSRVRTK